MSVELRRGILLVHLGTPDAPRPAEVRRYLVEFLSDPRVIDIAAPARWLLVRGIIGPFRSRKSAAAYRKVWTDQGSPLRVHGEALTTALGDELGPDYAVELGMRYGQPSIASALARLSERGVERIVALPLFPQYSTAATGSARAEIMAAAGRDWDVPAVSVLSEFHALPAFVEAQAAIAAPLLDRFQPDHVLMSYHGLPERQIRRSDPTGGHCLAAANCCEPEAGPPPRCYRAQCLATSRALTDALALDPDRVSSAFQSRLGRTKWIEPYTDYVLPELAERGVKRLALMSPSFAADCLETVEELDIRGRDQWRELGGEDFLLVPCVNADSRWVKGLAGWLRSAAA